MNKPDAKNISHLLTGFIEFLVGRTIQRVTFPSHKTEQVLEIKEYDYLLSFDLAPNGGNRLIETLNIMEGDSIILSSGNQLQVIFDKDFTRLSSFSPTNKEFAYLYSKYDRASEDWFKPWYLYLASLDGKTNRKVSDLPLSSYRPAWFPDGKRIAVTTIDYAIYIVDLESKTEKKIIDFGAAPAISHDGKYIAFLSKDISEAKKEQIRAYTNITEAAYLEAQKKKDPASKEIAALSTVLAYFDIYLYDIKTGETKKLTDKEKIMDQGVLWSPDGKYLAYNDEGLMSHEIYIVEIATGRQEKLTSIQGELMVWRKN